jgi:hypothetical protein
MTQHVGVRPSRVHSMRNSEALLDMEAAVDAEDASDIGGTAQRRVVDVGARNNDVDICHSDVGRSRASSA